MIVAIPRGDYWQCAQVIEKGGFPTIEARGIAAFRDNVAALVPGLAAGIDAVGSFDDVKLLSVALDRLTRSEEHTSELQSLMRISYAVFCLKKKKRKSHTDISTTYK